MPTDPTRPRRALDASGQLVAHPETKIARVPTGSAAPRAELGRACCPILIPRGGPRPWGSYQGLAPDARRLFRLLGLLPGQDVTAEAAAALAHLAPEHARVLLGRLAAAHLVDEHAPSRFSFHDLLREYAADRARQTDSEADRVAAVRRLLGWYLGPTNAAARLAYPDKVRHPAPAGEHRPPMAPFSADTQALAWLDAERPNLLAAIQHAGAHGPPDTAWLLADALRGYFLLRRYDIDWLAAARTGLAAAGDDQPAAQATMRLSLADRHWLVGEYAAATKQFTSALGLARRAGAVELQGGILSNLGHMHCLIGRPEEAAQHLTAAAVLNRQASGGVRAPTLGNLGILNAKLGRLEQAVDYQIQALAAYHEVGS